LQSEAATPLFDRITTVQSGVALRFPPHSKKRGLVARPSEIKELLVGF